MNRIRSAKAFTLVEIMIVVLIIGILLAIAIPNFIRARANSRVQNCLSNLKQINTAKHQFAMENGLVQGGAVNDAADLVPRYLMSWPSGPVSGNYAANAVGTDPSFNGNDTAWYVTHCTGATADSSCPF